MRSTLIFGALNGYDSSLQGRDVPFDEEFQKVEEI